jgi:hypothetical protein
MTDPASSDNRPSPIVLSLDRAEAACASALPFELSLQGFLANQIILLLLAPVRPLFAIVEFELWRAILGGVDLSEDEKRAFLGFYLSSYWFFNPISSLIFITPCSYLLGLGALRRSPIFFKLLKWLSWLGVIVLSLEAISVMSSFSDKGTLWVTRRVVTLAISVVFLYGFFVYYRTSQLSGLETLISAPLRKSDRWSQAGFVMFGIPRAVSRLSWRKYLIVPLFFFSSAAYFNIYKLVQGQQSGGRGERFAEQICAKLGPECHRDYAFWSFLALLCLPLLILLLALTGSMLANLARRFSTISLRAAQKNDLRRPIIFLRSFFDDQVRLLKPKLNILGRIAEFGRLKTNLDVLLLEEASPFGPVVALGNPSDLRAPYGAARDYVRSGPWQPLVAKTADDALAIVIVIDDTMGIWWEVEYVVANRHLEKTLFLLHPNYSSLPDNRRLLSKLCEKLEITHPDLTRQLGAQLNEVIEGNSVVGFFVREGGAPHLGTAAAFSRLTYLLMVRWFLRSDIHRSADSKAASRDASQ